MDGMEDETPEENATGVDRKECVLCEKIAAVVGLFLGGFIAFIGVDLLTGGRLTRLIGGTGTGDDDD
jgi:hypothetical protein